MHSDRIAIDLSHPLSSATPPFPGDPPLEITVIDTIVGAALDGRRHSNSSRIAICLHCGTHMDAPFHFFSEGRTIESVDVGVCVGPAALVHRADWTARAEITPTHLQPHEKAISEARRVVFRTDWHRQWKSPAYFTEHPVLTGATAEWLVARGVVLVGVDFPSVDRPPYPAHDVLLGNGVVIVENLTNLDAIGAKTFELSAIPLAIVGRDGSPVRAVATLPRRSEEADEAAR